MTTTTMRTDRRPAKTRCDETRARLTDFAANRLGATAAGLVQAHLLSCDDCSEVFSDLLMQEIDSGAVELLTPAFEPPVGVYDAYAQHQAARRLVWWAPVLEALQAADEHVRQWAREQHAAVATLIEGLKEPPLFSAPAAPGGAWRAHGAIRSAGSGPSPAPHRLSAAVVKADGTPTGAVVEFSLTSPPRVTSDGHFRLDLATDDADHDGCRVDCTLTGDGPVAVAFRGTITSRPGQRARELHIDEVELPKVSRHISPDRVSLSVIAP